MKCKKVQELLMTDCLDREVSECIQKQVEEHIAVCVECKRLTKELQSTASEPFKMAEDIKPASHLWQNIKDAIEEDRLQRSPFDDVRQRLSELFKVPRPAFAFATVAAIILIAVAFTRFPFSKQNMVYSDLQEEVSLLSYLTGNDEVDNGYIGDIAFGTTMEEYFL